MGIEQLNGFRIVFGPTNWGPKDEKRTGIAHVAVTLRAADAEEAVEKARLALELHRDQWRAFRVTPEIVE